jgi:nucleoside 2-deoxyribosyltransferase
MASVYLAGPINGCSDEEAKGWREAAKAALGHPKSFFCIDPMVRDFRMAEEEHAGDIVESDLADIRAAHVILVNASRPSWGTAMEVVYARQAGKWIVAFGTTAPSPWLAYHVDVLAPDLAGAIREITGGAAV